ncbi:MAG: metal-dependent hydrolase [Candidatus Babeliales bacterium]
MSNYKGHLAGGIFVYLLSIYFVVNSQIISFATALEWLLFCLLGSLFPDVDIKSKGQKIFYWIVLILGAILLFNKRGHALLILGVLAIFPLLVRHRGTTHRLWFVIVVPALVAWLACQYWPGCTSIIFYDTLFFIIGAISHLWLDFGLRRLLCGKA